MSIITSILVLNFKARYVFKFKLQGDTLRCIIHNFKRPPQIVKLCEERERWRCRGR